ncbi:MAG: hypothetical protein ACRDHS_02840 [Actinomycetota bacterium]
MNRSWFPQALIVAALAGTVVAAASAPAAATPPTDVEIVSPIDLANGTGSFEVVADDGDVLCDAGAVVNLFSLFVGGQSGSQAQILVVHEFTCDDGFGSFLLSLRVRLDFSTGTTIAWWSVLDGTGDYEELHGSGSLVGTPSCGPECIIDTYTGAIHSG